MDQTQILSRSMYMCYCFSGIFPGASLVFHVTPSLLAIPTTCSASWPPWPQWCPAVFLTLKSDPDTQTHLDTLPDDSQAGHTQCGQYLSQNFFYRQLFSGLLRNVSVSLHGSFPLTVSACSHGYLGDSHCSCTCYQDNSNSTLPPSRFWSREPSV